MNGAVGLASDRRACASLSCLRAFHCEGVQTAGCPFAPQSLADHNGSARVLKRARASQSSRRIVTVDAEQRSARTAATAPPMSNRATLETLNEQDPSRHARQTAGHRRIIGLHSVTGFPWSTRRNPSRGPVVWGRVEPGEHPRCCWDRTRRCSICSYCRWRYYRNSEPIGIHRDLIVRLVTQHKLPAVYYDYYVHPE
jgi:hypothetical protein